MLEGDKSLAIYFDSFETPLKDYYDALSDEDYTPCFTDVDFSLDSFDVSKDEFLHTMAHLDFEELPEDSVYDIAEYVRHAYNINRTLTPKTTK